MRQTHSCLWEGWMLTKHTHLPCLWITTQTHDTNIISHPRHQPCQRLKARIWETYCELLPRGTGWKQSAQQLGVGGGGGGYWRSFTANLREPKSLYLSLPESTKGLRTGGRRAARFNQPATRLASNPDLQICKHRFRTFLQSSVNGFWRIKKVR